MTFISIIDGIGAVATQADQTPLIFPLFGRHSEVQMNTWFYYQNNPRGPPLAMVMKLTPSYGNDIGRDEYNSDPPTFVFGTWTYERTTPSSAITFSDGKQPLFAYGLGIYGLLRIQAVVGHDTILGRLLTPFQKKMISLWWDSTTPFEVTTGPSDPFAELAIGGMNPSRFVPGTETQLVMAKPIISAQSQPKYWRAVRGTSVLIGNNPTHLVNDVIFGITIQTKLHIDLYNAITKPLRDEMAYTVGLLNGMPKDVIRNINQYEKVNKPIDEFDCKDGPKLLPLHIGGLSIPSRMMYRKISDEKCRMTLMRVDDSQYQGKLIIGIDIIRQFYLSVIYDGQRGDTLQFSKRVEGPSPAPPTERQS